MDGKKPDPNKSVRTQGERMDDAQRRKILAGLLSSNARLDGVSIRELIEEGRRF